MQYFDPDAGADLQAAFEAMVDSWASVTGTTMFGCPSYSAADTLFAVLVTEGVVLTKLPEDRREEIAERYESRPFQAGGRTITKWVQITVENPDEIETLQPFVEASYETALAEVED